MELGKSITLNDLPKLFEQLMSIRRHKLPIVKLSALDNINHQHQQGQLLSTYNSNCGTSHAYSSFTCSLCSASLKSEKQVVVDRYIFNKIFESFIKKQTWSLHSSLCSLTKQTENAENEPNNDNPLAFCQQCYKTMAQLESCYLELQTTIKEFQETVLRIRYFFHLSRKLHDDSLMPKDNKKADDNLVEPCLSNNNGNESIKKSLEEKTDNEDQNSHCDASSGHFSDINDVEDPASPSPVSNGSNNERIVLKKKTKSVSNRKHEITKPIRRHGGLTEEEYKEKRRAQSRGYYLARRKPPLIGPKSLSAQSLTKLKRAEKLCLDSKNFPAKSNCGRRVPVSKLDENRYSYRNVQFFKVESPGSSNTTETFCCEKCGHKCAVLNVMKKHIAKSHFEPDKAYKCHLCDKTFYYRFQLRDNEARHTEKGMGVQCEECGMSFKYKSGYFNHRRIIHWGIKPFGCETCGKKFGTRKDLRVHSLTHTGEKPHVCQYCGDPFKTAKSLQTHEQKNHAN